jgi:hypothetical protein
METSGNAKAIERGMITKMKEIYQTKQFHRQRDDRGLDNCSNNEK